VFVAHEALTALQHAQRVTPDACILNIGLPDMNGNELARQLRDLPGMNRVKLLALTGYGRESDRKTALAAGFNHHLVKPADAAKLVSLLNARIKEGLEHRFCTEWCRCHCPAPEQH
jgi:CheY-like chemotaxis protein